MPLKIILTGGGTGGHIFPALALARFLQKKEPGVEILFVGAKGGMEEKLVPAAGFKLKLLPVKGLPRSFGPKLFKAGGSLLLSLREAGRILKAFQPDGVIGTGGFAAGPVMIRSLLGRQATLLHEQNIIPGLTNRLLAPYVDQVCISFAESKNFFPSRASVTFTGNPRASEIVRFPREKARKMLGFHPHKPLLVVVGGSRGAAVLNQVFLDFLLTLKGTPLFQVFYVTGSTYFDKALTALAGQNILHKWQGELKIEPFYQDMPLVWSAADLVICRSGATTLAEITAAGAPALLVPSPNVVHDHQNLNARLLGERGAALVAREEDFTPAFLQEKVNELMRYPVLLREMRKKSLELGVPDAAERFYLCLKNVLSHKNT